MDDYMRVPLEARLKSAWDSKEISRMYADDYFAALSWMCGNAYYTGLYNGSLARHVPQKGRTTLAWLADRAWRLDRDQCAELLYRLLVEPFADPMWEET